MHRLVPVIVALLALGSSTPTTATQLTSPAASSAVTSCTAPLPHGTSPAPGTPGVEEVGTAGAGIHDTEAPLEPPTPPPGTPAGTAVLDRIRAAEENLAGCFNAGDEPGFTALLTPKALLAELGLSDPQATPAHSASYLIAREQIHSVRDAQTHGDGRVSAEVVFTFQGLDMRVRDIFIEQDGWLLLDED